jgi:hypothetical protein
VLLAELTTGHVQAMVAAIIRQHHALGTPVSAATLTRAGGGSARMARGPGPIRPASSAAPVTGTAGACGDHAELRHRCRP